MSRRAVKINVDTSVDEIERVFKSQLIEIMDAIDANLEEIAEFVYRDAKNTAEFIDRTGNLRASIAKRKSKFLEGGWIVKASGRNGRGDIGKGFHAHLVEFGHVIVARGKKTDKRFKRGKKLGNTGKRVQARPFMRPALAKGWAYALQLFRGNK